MPAPQEGDASSIPPTVSRHLAACYTNIIWMCLDSDLVQSAVFFAERYYALDHNNHDARHIFVAALLHAGRKNSALSLLKDHRCAGCCGCQHLRAQTCGMLGRHREAVEALEASLSDPDYIPTREPTFNFTRYSYSGGPGFYQPRCRSELHPCFQTKPRENACQGTWPEEGIFSSRPPQAIARHWPYVRSCGRRSRDCARWVGHHYLFTEEVFLNPLPRHGSRRYR
jgi:hypothetical protein